MSVKRRDLIRYLVQKGFFLLREGANHTIYSNGAKVIPVKRHKQLDVSPPTKSASKQASSLSSDAIWHYPLSSTL